MEKPVAGSVCLQCLNFHGKCFNFHGKCFSLKVGIHKFLRLIEVSCLQVMKGKLTIIPQCLTCFTHTCQLCVPTIVEVSLKRFFFCYTRQHLTFLVSVNILVIKIITSNLADVWQIIFALNLLTFYHLKGLVLVIKV